jgi:hypothetical protein
MKDMLSSKDWMSDYQQSHVDVDPQSVFGATSSTCSNTIAAFPGNAICTSSRQQDSHAPIKQEEGYTSQSSPAARRAKAAQPKTDWTGEYFSILVGQSPAAISQEPPAIFKPLSQHVVTRTSLRSRSLSRGSSIGSRTSSITKQSRTADGDLMDAIKPSVDFGALLTPSIDAALNSMNHTDSEKFVLLTSEDFVASMTTDTPLAAAAAAAEPIDMDIENETPPPPTTTSSTKPTSALRTDVDLILALSRKQKEEMQKTKQVPTHKKKRSNTRSRREPEVKEFVEPLAADVLLGRGGRSNHHSGNVAYRNEVGKLRDWYRTSEKNAKTDLSQLLVNWVHKEQHGRFLKLDAPTDRWYVVTNIVARRKASQALREHMTQEEREAKKGGKI